MVGPIYIIIIALGAAFLLPLIERLGRGAADAVLLLTLVSITFISGTWLNALFFEGAGTAQIFTAGFEPPFSISLRMGLEESVVLSAMNLLALLGGIYMLRDLRDKGSRAHILFLLFVLGLNGIVMTRDIFNLFIFIEILGISSYGLIGMDLGLGQLVAGFKYAMAGGIASVFLLLGIIFLYGYTGTLDIGGIASNNAISSGRLAIHIAIFLTLFALLIEMKQFPANGWALDVYETAHPGVSAMISAGSAGAILYAIYKILPIGGDSWYIIASVAGIATFLASNLMALMQRRTRRMLGYSSLGQIGLMLAVVGLVPKIGPPRLWMTAGFLFINHFIAKAGLFWLAGLVGRDDIEGWRSLSGKRLYLFLMGLFIVSLLGLPPFLGFWGKWTLIMTLASEGMILGLGTILLGSLLEAVYLLRWFGYAVRGRATNAESAADSEIDDMVETYLDSEGEEPSGLSGAERHIPLWAFAALTVAGALFVSHRFLPDAWYLHVTLIAGLALFLLDWLPAKIKGLIALAVTAYFSYRLLPGLSGFAQFFNVFFLGSGMILLIATLSRRGRSVGFYPLMLLLLGSLSSLATTSNILVFFVSWEIMTVSSYLLILRGKGAEKPSMVYAIFSLGGAFLLLAGIAIAQPESGFSSGFSILLGSGAHPPVVYTLFALGFLVKLAAIGLHIWAPEAYTEAENDVTPIVSGVLSKAGVLGFVILLARMGDARLGPVELSSILGWIGVATAFFATLYAVFQEDAKRLLAWSSVGQVGYIVLGLAAMSHLGWVSALYHTVNHLLFKGLLFLAIAGVIYRTGTRRMYEMGGLIKKMPLSFISVLMGIIALSGVPPLTGFGGKWLLYEALIERGWYLQTAAAFMASTIAFLYCFRLIHSVFLGQPKPRFKEIREAPAWFIIPQYILIMLIMGISFFPARLLKPISRAVAPVFEATIVWKGGTALSTLGYWNGTILMLIVMAVFGLVFVLLALMGPRPQKVGQFNIVFAAERPESPETTHYAYRFFTPYERAMAPLLRPLVRRFWNGVSEWSHTAADALRQVYTGNMQTYAVYIFIFGLLLYLLSKGVG
jgi:formate hydrogenlyase subunit 3/multisubunit Na+/H+ antiporter MnhD subunit